jgi:hypothetical protein
MEPWMLVVAAVIVVLPFVLMTAFNLGNRADARGRRTNNRWTSSRRHKQI